MNGVFAILLAAGLGTRLRPLTEKWPKCLMPIQNRPLLEYWLLALQKAGVSDVLVNTHYQSREVNNFLGRPKFKQWVITDHEDRLLGTAGTLRKHSKFLRNKITLLIHADNWCQCDITEFIEYHLKRRPAGTLLTMMTFQSDSPKLCGIVEVDQNRVVTAFYEKVENPPGKTANAAVYMLQPDIIEWIVGNPDVVDFSTQVLPNFLGKIATWENKHIHRDIGTVEALRKAQYDSLPDLNFGEIDLWQREFQNSPTIKWIKKIIN